MIDLVVAAGQKRVSARTGFVHLYPGEEFTDTIPTYENFCYAFALMRQKTAEGVLSGKELMGRLIAFQSPDGNFPTYLHEFPKSHDFHLHLKVAPILVYTLRLFSPVLSDLKEKIETALEKILAKAPEKSLWGHRYSALKGIALESPFKPCTSSEWTEWMISEQLMGRKQFDLPYDPDLHLFKVNSSQEKKEPRPHPIEWLLAEGSYSPRLLKDHPFQLLSAPLFPVEYKPIEWEEEKFRLFWQGSSLHSLVGRGLVFDLKEYEMGRNDLFEVAFYCDRSDETSIFVQGKKGTTFRLGDRIAIRTPQKTIELTFHLKEGEGDFCGHIFPSNRPEQIAKGLEAYDWQIGLRTLRRSSPARIEVDVKHFQNQCGCELVSAPSCL